jgi:hypothetical protein
LNGLEIHAMSSFSAWVVAWFFGTLLVLGFVFVLCVLTERRRLKTAGATQPLAVIRAHLALRLRGERAVDLGEACVGRKVWLEWDLRWGPSGQTPAAIVRKVAGNEVQLRSDNDIDLAGTQTDRVTLRATRATPRFGNCSGAAKGVMTADGESSAPEASATIVLL